MALYGFLAAGVGPPGGLVDIVVDLDRSIVVQRCPGGGADTRRDVSDGYNGFDVGLSQYQYGRWSK